MIWKLTLQSDLWGLGFVRYMGWRGVWVGLIKYQRGFQVKGPRFKNLGFWLWLGNKQNAQITTPLQTTLAP